MILNDKNESNLTTNIIPYTKEDSKEKSNIYQSNKQKNNSCEKPPTSLNINRTFFKKTKNLKSVGPFKLSKKHLVPIVNIKFQRNELAIPYLKTYVKNLKKINDYDKPLKTERITIFDKPIYNNYFNNDYSNEYINNQSNNNNYSISFSGKKCKKNLVLNEENKFSFLNTSNKLDITRPKYIPKIEGFVYTPRLKSLETQKDLFKLNKEGYASKNILFSKLRDLNYEKEVINIGRQFITSDKYFTKNNFNQNGPQFIEKKINYRILDNIKFNFKTPSEKSKLKKFELGFSFLNSVNKF